MTPVVYDQFKLKQNNGNAIDLDGTGLKVMVVTSSYVPSQAHATRADVVANEVSGTGYTARGLALTGITLALDGSTVEWVHDDITVLQSGAGFSNGRTLIWYHDTGTDSTSKLIMYGTHTSDFGNVAGDLTIDGSATTGVLNVS